MSGTTTYILGALVVFVVTGILCRNDRNMDAGDIGMASVMAGFLWPVVAGVTVVATVIWSIGKIFTLGRSR